MVGLVGRVTLDLQQTRKEFPRLTATNHWITSPVDSTYNCIAWAAGEERRNWWPVPGSRSTYWPDGVTLSADRQAFIDAYATIGFEPCSNGDLEPGIEKIALFEKVDVVGNKRIQHAARQCPDGNWTSKLGSGADISHSEAEDVGGGTYGEIACYLSRRVRT